ncbi:hypothetical protein JCM3774_004982 [Rhodotorula dairenensis]
MARLAPSSLSSVQAFVATVVVVLLFGGGGGAIQFASATAIQSPALYQCTPAAFQYQCSSPPCTVVARPSDNPAKILADLGTVNDASGTVSWPVNAQAGLQVTVYITDNTGVIGNGAPTTVAEGTSSACLNGGANTSSSASSASSASAASQSGSASASETETESSHSGTHSHTSSGSSGTKATSSGTTTSSTSRSSSSSATVPFPRTTASAVNASATDAPGSGAGSVGVEFGAVLGAAGLVAVAIAY